MLGSCNGFQIQSVCFDNLGLMLAAALNMLLKNNQRYILFHLSDVIFQTVIVFNWTYMTSIALLFLASSFHNGNSISLIWLILV